MLVYNNCAADPRVLKEATTLTRAGYAVRIVAVLDKVTVPDEDRDGIRITRVARDPLHYKVLRVTRRTRRTGRLGRARLRRARRRSSTRNRLRLRQWSPRAVRRAARPLARERIPVGARFGLRVARAVRWRVLRRVPALAPVHARMRVAAELGWRRLRYRAYIDELIACAPDPAPPSTGAVAPVAAPPPAPPLPPAAPPPPASARPPATTPFARVDRTVSAGAHRAIMTLHKPLLYLDWYWRAFRLLRDECIDVVHAHDLNTLPLAVALSRSHRARLIYDAHELYPEVSTLSARERAVWRTVEHRLIGRAPTVITVCESIADELQRRHGIGGPEVLLNCPPAAAPPVRGAELLRERAGLMGDSEPLVLYQGGFAEHRGLPELVRAAHSFEQGHLLLMGWGRLEDELRDQIAREGLAGRVHLVPRATPAELPALTAGADVGIIPYRPVGLNNTFTTPNKLFEYIAAGLPVAGSRLPELVRFLEGLGLGVTFDPGRPTDIASAVNRLLSDDDLRAGMRERALEVRERFTWERQADTLLSIYAR